MAFLCQHRMTANHHAFQCPWEKQSVTLRKSSPGPNVLLSRAKRKTMWTSSGPEDQVPFREENLCVLGEEDRPQSFPEGDERKYQGWEHGWMSECFLSMPDGLGGVSSRGRHRTGCLEAPYLEKFFSHDSQSHSSDCPTEAPWRLCLLEQFVFTKHVTYQTNCI